MKQFVHINGIIFAFSSRLNEYVLVSDRHANQPKGTRVPIPTGDLLTRRLKPQTAGMRRKRS